MSAENGCHWASSADELHQGISIKAHLPIATRKTRISPETLLKNNREWADQKNSEHSKHSHHLSASAEPRFLWLGCSDSQIPAAHITGTDPGEIFVHRNLGNIACPSDMDFLTALQYAVEVLHVHDIIVWWHYHCNSLQLVSIRT